MEGRRGTNGQDIPVAAAYIHQTLASIKYLALIKSFQRKHIMGSMTNTVPLLTIVYNSQLQQAKVSNESTTHLIFRVHHDQEKTPFSLPIRCGKANTGELRTGSSKWCDHTLTGVITPLGLHPVEWAPLTNVWNAIL